jgi:hypothetical protein
MRALYMERRKALVTAISDQMEDTIEVTGAEAECIWWCCYHQARTM